MTDGNGAEKPDLIAPLVEAMKTGPVVITTQVIFGSQMVGVRVEGGDWANPRRKNVMIYTDYVMDDTYEKLLSTLGAMLDMARERANQKAENQD